MCIRDRIEIAGDCVPIGGVSHGHALDLLNEFYGIPGGSEHTAVVIELPPGVRIIRRELLILFHQLCPELLLCLRLLRFMVGVVLVIVRKGHNAPLEVVPVSYTHLDVYKRQGLCCLDRL